MEFRTHFTERKVKEGMRFPHPTLTKQADKDACDINKIMRKYEITGSIDHISALRPVYGDATLFGDGYRDALAIVKRADEAFLELPSNLRTELANNPANLLQYMQNPANFDKCVEYGLFEKSTSAEPNVVNPIKSDEVSAQ